MPEYLSTLNKEKGTQSYTSRKFQDASTQMRLEMINNRNFTFHLFDTRYITFDLLAFIKKLSISKLVCEMAPTLKECVTGKFMVVQNRFKYNSRILTHYLSNSQMFSFRITPVPTDFLSFSYGKYFYISMLMQIKILDPIQCFSQPFSFRKILYRHWLQTALNHFQGALHTLDLERLSQLHPSYVLD